MYKIVLAALAVASLIAVTPAIARRHAPVQPVPAFWSIFQPKVETHAAFPARKHVRHAAHVRKHRVRHARLHRHVRVDMAIGVPTGTGGNIVEAARSQIGNGAIYGRRRLWCARFMNYVLEKTGHRGTGSDLAKSFTRLPHTDLHVGAIAVLGRRGGGHVGVVSAITPGGDPVIISGNHGGRVRETVYARRRVIEFVTAN